MSMSLPNPIRDVKPSEISRVLIQWYEINRRELPWRETSDPYKIWISEVILQQTRVAQGLEYYNRFVERFPDVSSLAEAGEDELMKMWQGLGYYSRARNLHTAACEIVERYAGVFPTDYHDVRSLKVSAIIQPPQSALLHTINPTQRSMAMFIGFWPACSA